MLTRYQRFTQIDADILQECRRFGTPYFIVRSKSDTHIRNMQVEDDELSSEEARDEFIYQTRASLEDNLRSCNLWDDSNPTESYIVAAQCVYDLMTGVQATIREAERGRRGRAQRSTTDVEEPREHLKAEAEVKKGGKLKRDYIDEEKLQRALLQTAIDRRYGHAQQ